VVPVLVAGTAPGFTASDELSRGCPYGSYKNPAVTFVPVTVAMMSPCRFGIDHVLVVPFTVSKTPPGRETYRSPNPPVVVSWKSGLSSAPVNPYRTGAAAGPDTITRTNESRTYTALLGVIPFAVVDVTRSAPSYVQAWVPIWVAFPGPSNVIAAGKIVSPVGVEETLLNRDALSAQYVVVAVVPVPT
jgi:hypothetical protein